MLLEEQFTACWGLHRLSCTLNSSTGDQHPWSWLGRTWLFAFHQRWCWGDARWTGSLIFHLVPRETVAEENPNVSILPRYICKSESLSMFFLFSPFFFSLSSGPLGFLNPSRSLPPINATSLYYHILDHTLPTTLSTESFFYPIHKRLGIFLERKYVPCWEISGLVCGAVFVVEHSLVHSVP